MKAYAQIFFLFLIAGCAGQQSAGDREVAPYSAVVVFQWQPDDDRGEGTGSTGDGDAADDPGGDAEWPEAAAEDAPDPDWIDDNREWIETQITMGLEEHGVFSHFVVSDWESMDQRAEELKADLIVVIRIGSLADWNEAEVSVDSGLAVLTGFLWFLTAIGGVWVQDQVYPTESDIEVYWRRPPRNGAARGRAVVGRESVYASGEYQLSLWDRAKIWKSPGPYFMNLIVPASFVPFYDEQEIDRSLVIDALEDVKRDLAQKLRAGNVGAAGEPFLFRLEDPVNGDVVQGSSARLRFSYRLEPGPGFAPYENTALRALHIDLKREDQETFERVDEYKDKRMSDLNKLIKNSESITVTIDGLGPGLNLVRFSAETEFEGRWITNTIALNGP